MPLTISTIHMGNGGLMLVKITRLITVYEYYSGLPWDNHYQ